MDNSSYFSDVFDLPYLRAAAENNNIKLDIGLDNSQPIFSKGRLSKGKITGIIHIDIYRFIESVYSQYLQSETLGLNDIASELLGQKKHDFDFSKLEYLNKNDWKDFFKYNLQDSKLTYLLFEKTWPDIQEFTNIIQEPIFRTTRNSMSAHVEDYILHNLNIYNEIAEKRPLHDEIAKRRAKGKYGGAFVFQPSPGLYENIGMFDFTSMYASVIVSYNLSLSTLIGNPSNLKNKNLIKVNLDEREVYFSKKQGFFPKMLKEIIDLRKQYKKQYNKNKNPITKARSNAYKLLANAAYGYQGYFGARYYCRQAAASTAKLAKENILNAIEKIKKQSYKIIYSDTDSIAFLLNNKTKKQTLEFLNKLNSKLPGIMELELEDFYKRGLFVSKRTVSAGAKKKYALIDYNNQLKVRGFETVRRDWCNLARQLQNKVLELILKNGNEKSALKYLKKTIKKVKNRDIQKKQLIIKTQLNLLVLLLFLVLPFLKQL
jgi:DNA polymerase elongation subunit (family B)